MSYSPQCGRHSHTVRYRAAASRHTVSTPPARLRVRPGCHRPTELARAGLKIRVLRRPARDRGFSYIALASRARERSSYPIDTLFVRSYPPLVSPLCGLTNNGLHRHGSRYDHFCGQLPELSRTTRAHVIQWVACVPPRDLRAPFFPPHLVAHSEDRAPRQSVISKVIGVSDELWRAEGGT